MFVRAARKKGMKGGESIPRPALEKEKEKKNGGEERERGEKGKGGYDASDELARIGEG